MEKSFKHEVPGVAGVRKSPRVYLFAVVGNRDLAADRAADLKSVPRYSKENFDYMVREAGPNRKHEHSAEKLAEYARVAALGLEGYVAEVAAEVNARHDRYDAAGNELGVLQWSMSERAARNAVGTFVNRGWKNVAVREVVRS